MSDKVLLESSEWVLTEIGDYILLEQYVAPGPPETGTTTRVSVQILYPAATRKRYLRESRFSGPMSEETAHLWAAEVAARLNNEYNLIARAKIGYRRQSVFSAPRDSAQVMQWAADLAERLNRENGQIPSHKPKNRFSGPRGSLVAWGKELASRLNEEFDAISRTTQ